MKKSVTIIGYGFISQYFLKEYHNQFQSIITTTRSSNNTKFSTQSFTYDLYINQKITFPKTNYCIITIPFSRSLTDPFDYPNSLERLLHQLPIQHYERILFTSSTSVYKPNNSLITENQMTPHYQDNKIIFYTPQLSMCYYTNLSPCTNMANNEFNVKDIRMEKIKSYKKYYFVK